MASTYKVLPVDIVEDRCRLCPVGIIRTHDYGNGHLHDFCDGCSWRACLPAVGSQQCWYHGERSQMN